MIVFGIGNNLYSHVRLHKQGRGCLAEVGDLEADQTCPEYPVQQHLAHTETPEDLRKGECNVSDGIGRGIFWAVADERQTRSIFSPRTSCKKGVPISSSRTCSANRRFTETHCFQVADSQNSFVFGASGTA